ncbi:MAG: hypothetical protein IT453_05080 [Planctomycetes bacterium]|nr:hypothetical protein [Planctomycetota bacterium]
MQSSFPHARRALAHTSLLLFAACGGTASEAPPAPDAAPLVREIEEAFAPVSDSTTSDVKDRALALRRATLERLRGGSPELGRAAWKRFQEVEKTNEELRIALLDVASHTAPDDVKRELARMVSTYGPEFTLRIRTHAVRFLAETAPKEAVELLTPLVREPQRATTYPPQETLLDCWIVASRKLGNLDERLLADVAIGIQQPADARYRAIEELGRVASPVTRDALELVLTESGSDGYLRRKAAQAVIDGLPRADACALLERIADREVDQVFLVFLADMLQKNCP